MKLATRRNTSAYGELVVVSADDTRALAAELEVGGGDALARECLRAPMLRHGNGSMVRYSRSTVR